MRILDAQSTRQEFRDNFPKVVVPVTFQPLTALCFLYGECEKIAVSLHNANKEDQRCVNKEYVQHVH